jgi:pentatricopeptide repeat protein
LRRLREAIAVLESGFAKGFGGTSAFRDSRIEPFYDAPIRILAERGDAGEAFSLFDRMRERQRRARCADCDELAPAVTAIDALKRGIEPGTLVIAYRVQPDATYAFVATRDAPMRVYRIDEKDAVLRARVQSFLERVRARSVGTAYEAPLVAAGRALFDLLFGQFEHEASAAERLLIVADGPLDALPFSALARARADASKWQYLADWKPMIFAPSVTAAAAWAGGAAPVGAPAELFLSGVPAETTVVGVTLSRGTLVSLWPQTDAAGEEFAELFKVSLSGRPRENALTRAQRAMRDERGRTHPSQWAGYRYYGARGIR